MLSLCCRCKVGSGEVALMWEASRVFAEKGRRLRGLFQELAVKVRQGAPCIVPNQRVAAWPPQVKISMGSRS